MCVSGRYLNNLGTLGPRLAHAWPVIYTPSPTWITAPNFMSMHNPPQNGPLASLHSRSLQVMETDTDQSSNHDFLLTWHWHSYHGPVVYRFQDNSEILAEIANFSNPTFSNPLMHDFYFQGKTWLVLLLGTSGD